MKGITIDEIYSNDDFMYFWDFVYGEGLGNLQLSLRNLLMEVAYISWLAGIDHQRRLIEGDLCD